MADTSAPWRSKRQVEYRGLSALIVRLARAIYNFFGPIVRRIPGFILLAAVVATILLVWVLYLTYEFVDSSLIGVPTDLADQTGLFGGPLSLSETAAGLREVGVPLAGLFAYVFYPFQYEMIRDLIGVAAIVGFISLVAVYSIWWERKVAGHMQSRVGPMRVGGWHGWAQSPADGLKLVCKEDLIPAAADRPLFRLAPYLAFIPAVLAFLALPFGTYWVFRELDVALIVILAMLGVEVMGVIIAGWASHNKWSVFGAMREACQIVSYEIPMGLALLIPIISAGTLSLTTIGEMQSGGWHTWLMFRNPFTFLGAVAYYIAALASCKRAPFDLPESESELVAGFHTEYSGYRWAIFFFAEYAGMFAVSALCVILFLGAWHSPLPASWAAVFGDSLPAKALEGAVFSGPLWFILKAMSLVYVQMWLRWTLPRVRIDQVLYACVQVMLPLVMLLLLGHTVYELLVPVGGVLYTTLNIILSIIGAVIVLAALSVVVYGFWNRRRLVGYLGVDLLPGA